MSSFDITLNAYHDDEAVVCIPSGVTDIAPRVFTNKFMLARLIIPEGVRRIGAFAFNACMQLKEVQLPSTLEIIEDGAFCGESARNRVSGRRARDWL